MTAFRASRLRPPTGRGALAIRLTIGIGLAIAVAGCGPAAAGSSALHPTTPATSDAPARSGPPTFEPTLKPTPVPTSAYHPSPSPAATPPSKTKTAWGVIWDALPRGFPTPPAAEPTDTGDAEAASATLAVPTAAGRTAEWYRSALPSAGYSIESVNGPYENGGFVIDAVGASPDCRVQVSLARSGTTTTVTILFGAACRFRV